MLLLISFLLILQCHCKDAELTDSDNCSETGNCSETLNCIGSYDDLELHVLNSRGLLTKIREAFFITGKKPSQFVKIVYNFQVYNSTHDEIAGYFSENCSSQQTTFIWSESVLYLLGPNPLFWLTLFAVNVEEIVVTIELPCLCDDAYHGLLS